MVAKFRWSVRWRGNKELWLLWFDLSSHFQIVLILWLVFGVVSNLMVMAQQQRRTNSTNSFNMKNTNLTEDDESGSWEYYYDDEDDPINSTFVQNAANRAGKPSNSTAHGDEYYYYFEEEVLVKPKNGSGPGKVIKTTTLKVDKSRKGARRRPSNDVHVNSAASGFPQLGIGGNSFGGSNEGIMALPSIEPLKELATPIEIEGPVYTDNNYGPTDYNYYNQGGPDTAIGKPLGPGEFPPDPFKEAEEPVLLRPPPPPSTQPPAESGLELDIVKHVELIDGVVPISESGEGESVGDIGEDVKSAVFDDGIKNYNLLSELPNLRTKFKVEAYGSIAPEKNPIIKAKEFVYHLWEIITTLTKSELVLWAEKGFNLVAELSIPQEHYLRVISFAGIYLFVSMLTYGAKDVTDFVCEIETRDKPLKTWKHHAARRFVPARSVDPHMQKKFLKLFRGAKEKDKEEKERLDINSSSSSRSSEEDIADELDHISELCPEDAFFYSLNPRHIEAYTLLQHILIAQDSPKKFLRMAKRLLHKEKVHPKVWYFAIIGAFLARQDLTGFSVVHPLDAIPDWYIPADLISKHMKSYKKIRVKRSYLNSNISSSTAFATISFSQEEEAFYEGLPLKLPVKSGKGNYTVTIVTSKKGNSTSLNNLSSSLPFSDEISNSVETKEIIPNSAKSKEEIPNLIDTREETESSFETEEEIRNSVETKEDILNSVEPKEKVIVYTNKQKKKTNKNKHPLNYSKKKKMKKQVPKPNPEQKPIVKQVTKPAPTLPAKQVTKVKGDKGELAAVKAKVTKGIKGNGTHTDYLLDNRHHGRRSKKGKKCIKVNWKVGLDNGIENELWYWREDMMLNQHHWYWHQTHPVNSTLHADRRAELFFYMHRAIVARYNAERLSNGMKRATPLKFRRGGIIHSGYNSHLADINADIYWQPRWPHTPLSDIYHEDDPDFAQNITLAYYESLCQRLIKAIRRGKILPSGAPPLPINHVRGIEVLANTIEAADISVNPLYYDPMGIHALGHIMVGLASDPDFIYCASVALFVAATPDYRFKSVTGVMSDAAVSMRDPAFYSYHTFMDNIFELHKERLPPYEVIGGEFPLLWKGVKILKIELHSQGGAPKNELRTFWTKHKFELSPGVDRSIKIKKGKKKAQVCAQHLDHEPFYFKIVIYRQACVKSKSGQGTVRIFMAPRYDEKGRRIPVKIQRRLMFPLDSFPVKLKVGKNVITRYAEDSSLTQPWTKSIRDFERGPDPSGAAEFCGCGWPQHLYIPKGHASGMSFDLFVMVTNYDEDHVPNDPKILEIPEACNSPYIFCGLPRRRYPDRRPMGYPFDRPLFKSFNCPPGWTFFSVFCKSLNLVINRPLDTLEEYVSKAPNMKMLKIHIRHLDTFLPEPARHR